MKIDLPIQLEQFCNSAPAPVYVVGGFVRNRLLKLPDSHDIDICGPEKIENIAGSTKFTFVNKSLGTALLMFGGGVSAEYTQFRKEEYAAGGGHSPLSVTFTDQIKEDALRRDFTINAIYYDVKNQKIVDVLGGEKDLLNRQIRCEEPQKVFASDGLRLLRLCRFAATLGFDINPETFAAASTFFANLQDIAAERKMEELNQILLADQKYGVKDAHYRGLKLMHSLGLFHYVLPVIEQMEIEQNPAYHMYNVLEHTLQAVRLTPPRLTVRLAALMHDTGKPLAMQKDGNMYNHAEYSTEIVRRLLGQGGLKYPDKTVFAVQNLVKNHMYDKNHNTKGGKMRLFVAANFDYIDDLQALCEADALATGREITEKPRFAAVRDQLIAENAPIKLTDLKVNGNDAAETGLQKSEIAAALNQILHESILQPRLNTRDYQLARLIAIRQDIKQISKRDK